MDFDISVLLDQRQLIAQGVGYTLAISLVSILLAMLMGLLVAFGQLNFTPLLQWGMKAYVQFFRNTPLLIQIYFFYKGLPNLGVNWPPEVCGVVALFLQSGAYMAEIFRTGVESIPKEQVESALSLGFSRLQTFVQVIIPQAVRIILPPLGNQCVAVIKNSSLVAFITVPDLFYVVFNGGAEHFRYLEFFLAGIVVYMILTLMATGLFRLLEYQLSRRERQSQEPLYV
jgi:His/Glu/Gln/Arg/opine family amino acid ABC transporter permease subunit